MNYQIKRIIIYPIKSMGGVLLNECVATEIGFLHDREYMLIDANGKFITQREKPELALFDIELDNESMTVSYKNERYNINYATSTRQPMYSKVWDDQAIVSQVSDEADSWFSHQLNDDVKLVKLFNKDARKHINSSTLNEYNVSLADGYPYLVVGTASIDYLNNKLQQKIGYNRFRPNIVVETILPHEEDSWAEIKIGSVTLQNVKPCGRCMIITIDPFTATADKEPLQVLSKYRRKENSIYFGTNMVVQNEGIIKVGDWMQV